MRALLALALLLTAGPAHAANAFIQSALSSSCNGASTCAATLTGVGEGNLVIAVFHFLNNPARTVTSVCDDGATCAGGHVYTHGCTGTGVITGNHSIYYLPNNSSGNKTVTVTMSGTNTNLRLRLLEVSGADTSTPLDQCSPTNDQTNPGTGTDAVTSASVNTTTDGQFIVGFSTEQSANAVTWTAGTGYTLANGGSIFNISEHQVQTSAGAIAATFTQSSASADFRSGIATFKAAGGAASSPPNGAALLGVGK
jgi:hypothetical protein